MRRKRSGGWVAGLVVGAWLWGGCATVPRGSGAAEAERSAGRATVLVVSVDGFRPDYLERGLTPFLSGLAAEGALSREVRPIFPTVTFQSHVAIATGAWPDEHGIVGNSFYDTRTRTEQRYAPEQRWLEAEPFWITASRQGVRTAVFDWVNAHRQTGPVTAAYFGERYEAGLTDRQRIGQVLDAWARDDAAEAGAPLRFLLGYLDPLDKAGHTFGPDSAELNAALGRVDALLAGVYAEARAIWARTRREGDTFWFVIVSDHGMAPIHTEVNLARATGLADRADVTHVASGVVGHVFFDRVPAAERAALQAEARARLEALGLGRVHARDTLPSSWRLAHPHRTGDLVWVLDREVAFGWRMPPQATVWAAQGPTVATHGWEVEVEPLMRTIALFHRHPGPLGGRELGPVSNRQLHPTLMRLLGVGPAPLATAEPIELGD